MVAEDLGAGVDFMELFVELRETAIRKEDAIRAVAIEIAAKTIEGVGMRPRGKRAVLNSPF